MRRIPVLVAALLLPATQPLLLSIAVSTGTLLLSQTPAHAQGAEAVAKVAKAITVRIEGATQGSGVLVKRDGNRYTVLTAWHVLNGQRPGEELDIYTPDGQRHLTVQGSIQRISNVDMATLNFVSANIYPIAITENSKTVSRGNSIIVAGFPRAKQGIIDVLEGIAIANADIGIDNGYRLLYTSKTEAGMSGGPVLSSLGKLVAIHGRGELDSLASDLTSMAIKTGANQGVPVDYFTSESMATMAPAIGSPAQTIDDYIAEAKSLLSSEGIDKAARLHTADKLLSKAIDIQKAPEAYLFRAAIRYMLSDLNGSLADSEMAYKLDPNDFRPLIQLARLYKDLGRKEDSSRLLSAPLINIAKSIPDEHASSIISLLVDHGERPKALIFVNQLINNNPTSYQLLEIRAILKKDMGDNKGAIADLREASKYGIPILGEDSILPLIKRTEGTKSAIAYYSFLIAREPRREFLYHRRAWLKEEAGDLKGFFDDSLKAFELSRQRSRDYAELSQAKLKVRDRSGALQDLQNAVKVLIGEKDADAYRTVADAQKEVGDIQGALNTLNLAIQRFPRDSFNYSARGMLRKHQLNDHQGAIEDYMNSARLSNYDGISVSSWASEVMDPYYKAGDKRYIYAAIDVYGIAISRNPRDEFLFSSRARLKAGVGDLYGALDDLNKAVLLSGRYHKERAEVLLALGRSSEASADIDQAISRVTMTDALELAQLAEILHSRLGQTQKALELISKGLRSSGEYVDHLYLARARIRAGTGDTLGACKDYRIVTSSDKENSESREWLKSSKGATCR